MQQEKLERFEEAVFHANVAYELVLFDRLPPEQRQLLSALQRDTDFYGVLRPRQRSELGVKSVDRDTALLFLTLQEPGHIPAYVKSQLGEQCHKTMIALVLDKVLEIEWHGIFVSGLQAYELLYAEQSLFIPRATLARLSLEAVKYAQALDLHDSAKLSARLYCYNRIPLSPYWQRKFPTSDAVAEYLGLQAHSTNTLLLKRHWIQATAASSFDGWFVWSARHVQPEARTSHFIYKLYVSPACEFIRDAFQTIIGALVDGQATSFKIGKDLSGLLRPDKLVVYFPSMEAYQETVALLKQKLSGLPAHGVPFTAEIAGEGLLSWGIDPPVEEQVFHGPEGESWRLWVTNRLATALLTAKADLSDKVEPWQFALERLRLDGVDTESWTPPQFSWRANL